MTRAENTEVFREWNQKMIRESAKMMKVILVLLIGWTLVTIGWIIHLILIESSRENPTYLRYARGHLDIQKFDELHFYTIVKEEIKSEKEWKRIKTLIGGLHQLKEDSGKVPFLKILTKYPLDEEKRVESLPWNKVEFKTIKPKSKSPTDSIWISSDYSFDPVALDLRKADLLGETELFRDAFAIGRGIIEDIGNEECLKLIDPNREGRLVLKTNCNGNHFKVGNINDYGMKLIENSSNTLACHVDLKGDIIRNGAELVDLTDYHVLSRLNASSSRKLAIAVPTTSKGMKRGEKPVLLTTLIPSIHSTLLKEEREMYEIVIFIGYDRGDEYFESHNGEIKEEIEGYGMNLTVIFLRLSKFKRVAMTWNMIFQFARKYVRFDYYYQVNDDLRMITAGWLSEFSGALAKVDDIGVCGPSDSFNGFSCSLLTQSFVSERHFEIFDGFLYPLEFRDWKSDRWLSFVYGPKRTFCRETIKADNGAKGTRYEWCQFSEWKIYLEKGKRRTKEQGIDCFHNK